MHLKTKSSIIILADRRGIDFWSVKQKSESKNEKFGQYGQNDYFALLIRISALSTNVSSERRDQGNFSIKQKSLGTCHFTVSL